MTELESLFSAATPNSDHDKGRKLNRRASGQKPDKVQLVCTFSFNQYLSSPITSDIN